jgi:predicted nucleic acid-binding protein
MIIVLDTSAAIEIILNKKESENFKKIILEADAVIAPELYISEITNVAWKYNKISNFGHEECYSLSEDGINLIDQFIDTKFLWKEALREAMNNNQSVYDCLYLICARRNDGILLTKDQKLKKLCRKLKIETM